MTKKKKFSSILKRRREGETSTFERNIKESSFNEEDDKCLKTSYEGDTIPGIQPSYAQLFRMGGQLVKENDKQRERTIGLKESPKYLKEINDPFKIEITKLRN